MKSAFLIWGVAITLLSSLLFEFKHAVQDGWDRLDQLGRDITVQREALRVLRAEWSHLNRPDRLAWLAEKHLNLEPVQPGQILSWTRFKTRFPLRSESPQADQLSSLVPDLPDPPPRNHRHIPSDPRGQQRP